jgi:hypothetical protein
MEIRGGQAAGLHADQFDATRDVGGEDSTGMARIVGNSCGVTRSWMLRATPGCFSINPSRSRVLIIW